MPVDLIRTDALTAAAPYAYASVVTAGSLVFTAGACPLDAEGRIGPPDDVAGQAARVMENLVTALAAAGAALTDVAKTTVYVATADRADLTDRLGGGPGGVRRPRRPQHPALGARPGLAGPARGGGGRRGHLADDLVGLHLPGS